MSITELRKAQAAATAAAGAAGLLMAAHRKRAKKVNSHSQHDIKLDLDVRCQRVITQALAKEFPDVPVLGEEGQAGSIAGCTERWVVDPIDGTVNFAHRIPHAAVSIALQVRTTSKRATYPDGFQTMVGVVLDPFVNELWTAIRGQTTRLNGRPTRVSQRNLLQAIVSLGFSGRPGSVEAMLRDVGRLSGRVRKIRMMGSAALALAYVADGRFDAYIEHGIRLWDIAAGGLLVECAGGKFHAEESSGDYTFRMSATNAPASRELQSILDSRK